MFRFDLVFLILDPQDEQFDKRLGRHLVSLYFKDEAAEEEEFLSMKVLRDYVKFAKDRYHPKLSDEAGQKMIQHYVEMRKVCCTLHPAPCTLHPALDPPGHPALGWQ